MTVSVSTTVRGLPRRAPVVALLAAFAMPASTDVSAISRYDSTSMPCSLIKDVIRNEGAVILRHVSSSTGNLLYNRYVRNANHCRVDQTTKAKSVPAADTKNCTVYYCVKKERNCNNFFGNC